jgi:hypothetical protein
MGVSVVNSTPEKRKNRGQIADKKQIHPDNNYFEVTAKRIAFDLKRIDGGFGNAALNLASLGFDSFRVGAEAKRVEGNAQRLRRRHEKTRSRTKSGWLRG